MISITSTLAIGLLASSVLALNPRLVGRYLKAPLPDRGNLTSLIPVDWHQLLQGSYDPYVEELFKNLDLNYTHNAVSLARSSYISNISCESNTSLIVSFIDNTAFEYIKTAWKVEDEGQEFVIITPTSGCKLSQTISSYWLVTNVTFPAPFDGKFFAKLEVEDLTAPDWAINCNAATENKTYLGQPTAPCGNTFDPLLDSRIGFYDFNRNFTSDLKQFAPELQSYNETDYTAIGVGRRSAKHTWIKRAPLNPRVLARAIANVTIVNAIANIDNLAIFAQSIQDEAIYVPDRISPDGLLTLVPFAPAPSPQPQPQPQPSAVPTPAPVPAPEPNQPEQQPPVGPETAPSPDQQEQSQQSVASTPAADPSPAPAPTPEREPQPEAAPVPAPSPAEGQEQPQPSSPSPPPELPRPVSIVPAPAPVPSPTNPEAPASSAPAASSAPSAAPIPVPVPIPSQSASAPAQSLAPQAPAPPSSDSPVSSAYEPPRVQAIPSPSAQLHPAVSPEAPSLADPVVPSAVVAPSSASPLPSVATPSPVPSAIASPTSTPISSFTSSYVSVSSESTVSSESSSSQTGSSALVSSSLSSIVSSSLMTSSSIQASSSVSGSSSSDSSTSSGSSSSDSSTSGGTSSSSTFSDSSFSDTSSSSSSTSETASSFSSTSSDSSSSRSSSSSSSTSSSSSSESSSSPSSFSDSSSSSSSSSTSSSTTSSSSSSSFSSSLSIDNCSYSFSGISSQYKRCGDGCSTYCGDGGSCNTYCPSTSSTYSSSPSGVSTTAPPSVITTSSSSSTSSSTSSDSCNYIFSDVSSQYRQCGDGCSTYCGTDGGCQTYCPETSSSSSVTTTAPPSITTSPPTTTAPPTDTCSYYYSDATSQYRYCNDRCSTYCYEGDGCQTECPGPSTSSSVTTTPQSVPTTPPTTQPPSSTDTCSYYYSDAVSQYRYCNDGCSTACQDGRCQTYCSSTSESVSLTLPPASTTSSPGPTAPEPTSSDGLTIDIYSISDDTASISTSTFTSSSEQPAYTGARKRQDIASSVANLGRTLGFKQTPIREASQNYGTVGDEQGNVRMANQEVTDQVPWNTWGDSAVTDSLDRFLHYFPDTMDQFGVSRLRVAEGTQLPEGSSAVALTPIDVSTTRGSQSKRQNQKAKSVYVPLNTRAQPFYPIMCTFQGSIVSKLYLSKSPKGVQTLQNPRLRKILTGGRAADCGVVSLESRSVAGLSSQKTRGRQ